MFIVTAVETVGDISGITEGGLGREATDRKLLLFAMSANAFPEDIKESIKKILGDKRQKEYLIEHLKVFSKLGDVIKYGKLVSESMEQKARQNYNSWHYYVENIIIGKKKFLLEFDVVSRNDGENHYRIQRLVPLDYEKNKSPNSSISSKTMGTASVRPVSTEDNTTI